MGMYTRLDFKVVVKPRFRNQLGCFQKGEWKNSDEYMFRKFGEASRADWIPMGGTAYWEHENNYEEATGVWEVSCALKNYEGTIGKFFELMPFFVESVENMETYEETPGGVIHTHYKLQSGKVIEGDSYMEW